LNIMHAAFLAVQYDPSDNDLLMRCQVMVNDLCGRHLMMPSFEVSISKLLLLSWLLKREFSDINVRLEKPLPAFQLNASAIMRSLMMTEAFS